jgi:hypothetical protein
METVFLLYFCLTYLLGIASFIALTGELKYFWFPKLTLFLVALYVILTMNTYTGPGGLGSMGRLDLLLLIPPAACAIACLLFGFLVNRVKQLRAKNPSPNRLD